MFKCLGQSKVGLDLYQGVRVGLDLNLDWTYFLTEVNIILLSFFHTYKSDTMPIELSKKKKNLQMQVATQITIGCFKDAQLVLRLQTIR